MNRYRQILNSATEFAIVVTDRDGIVTDWNTGAERILGWTAAEIVGTSAETIFTPEDRRAGRVRQEMDVALAEGRGLDERWHLKADGSRFWASGEMMPLRDDAGAHVGFVKILRDRTERHLAGVRLQEMTNQLAQAQKAGGVGLFTIDVASDILAATPEFSRLYGLDHQEGRPATDFENLVLPEDRERVSISSTSRTDTTATDVRYRIRRPDTGGVRWLARTGEFQLDAAGRPLRFVGASRDVTAQVEAQARLADSEAKWRSLFEQLHEGFILGRAVRDEAGRIVDWAYEEVNRAWQDLTGIAVATALGRTVRDVFPGIEDAWVIEFANVVETGEAVHFTRQLGTLGRWYDGFAQPVGGDRFSVIFREVTERTRAEARRAALVDLSDALLRLTDPVAMARAAAESIGRALKVGRVGYGTLAADGETITVPSDWTANGRNGLVCVSRLDDHGATAADLRQGRTVVIPDVRTDARTADDAVPPERLAVRAMITHPVVEDGRTVAVLFVDDDEPRHWTVEEVAFLADAAGRVRAAVERRRAESRLRDSDERQRLAIEVGEVGVFDMNLATGELFWDDRVRAAFGVSPGRVVAQAEKLAAVHPGDRAAFDLAFAEAMSGGTFDLQFRTVGIDDAVVRFVAVRGRVVENGDSGRAFVGAVRDVTERLAAEEHRSTLSAELAHRLKNTLALVQSIATQTLRTAPDVASARKTLTDRIQALSKAHDILLTGQRDAASIAEIVRAATVLHDDGNRVRLSGPVLTLGPKASLTLSLILHELATNAAKYGSLSVDGGHVDVAWSVSTDGANERPKLTFEWREVGGPPVTPPTRRSFGTRLIEMGLSGSTEGASALIYDPDGLRCRITASLTELQSADGAES